MEVNITYRGGTQYEAEARGHKVICDQPYSNGGQDTGMTPPEFLLTSLGTCAMYYAASYLRLHNLPAEGMSVHVEADKAVNPARLSAFRMSIDVPLELEERHVEGARRSAEKCLVKNTLMIAPEIHLTIRSLHAVA